MKNVVSEIKYSLKFKFDLKGSKYTRLTKYKKDQTMKDINLQNILLKNPNLVNLKFENRAWLIEQLSKDS
jgi:hypothetical protein